MSAEEAKEKDSIVAVQGQAEIQAKPDQATVRVGVTQMAPTAGQAQQRVNQRMQAIFEELSGLGVADDAIQTAQLTLSPVYSRYERDQAPTITGYQASNTLSVRLDDLNLVGPVLDAVTKAGGNEIKGVNFDLKDDSEIQKKALAQAVRNAVTKAGVMAEALGMKLGRVIELSESTVQIRPVFQQQARFAAAEAAAPTPVAPGQVSVSAQVSLRCALVK